MTHLPAIRPLPSQSTWLSNAEAGLQQCSLPQGAQGNVGISQAAGKQRSVQAVQNFTLYHGCMLGLLTKRNHSAAALLLNNSVLSISGKVLRCIETSFQNEFLPFETGLVGSENLVLSCITFSTVKAFQT